MQSVQTEDITVPWGQQPDPLDFQFGKWRLSVFQDLQESLDSSKLYFLYDPVADENCVTTGGRKAMTSIVVFDTLRKCFVAEIPIRIQGRVKFFFALKTPSPAGGTALSLVTQSEDYGQFVMHVWRINLTADGLSLAGEPYSLLASPLIIDNEFICTMREDAPELVVIFGPGMNVVRVNAAATQPSDPVDRFNVPGSELSHFYDAYVSRGNVYFISATPDGHFDHSRVHILNLGARGAISTQYVQPDPSRGNPPARKQAAIDAIAGYILLAGGEVSHQNGNVDRLVDYWVLDLTTFRWNQVPAQMPVPLIEPRLTTANSGNVYLWGDYDEPLPGMPPGTHVRILRIRGFNMLAPPTYDQAMHASPYPQAPGGGGGGYGGYGGGGYGGAPTSGYPSYPSSGGAPPSYPPASGGGYPSQPGGGGGYSQYGQPPQTYGFQQQGTHAYYPQPEQKSDCMLM